MSDKDPGLIRGSITKNVKLLSALTGRKPESETFDAADGGKHRTWSTSSASADVKDRTWSIGSICSNASNDRDRNHSTNLLEYRLSSDSDLMKLMEERNSMSSNASSASGRPRGLARCGDCNEFIKRDMDSLEAHSKICPGRKKEVIKRCSLPDQDQKGPGCNNEDAVPVGATDSEPQTGNAQPRKDSGTSDDVDPESEGALGVQEGSENEDAQQTCQPEGTKSEPSDAGSSFVADQNSTTNAAPWVSEDTWKNMVQQRIRLAEDEGGLMERAEDIFLRLEILESASKECAMVSEHLHTIERIIMQFQHWQELLSGDSDGSHDPGSSSSSPQTLEQKWANIRSQSSVSVDANQLAITIGGVASECADQVSEIMHMEAPSTTGGTISHSDIGAARIMFFQRIIQQISQVLGKYSLLKSWAVQWSGSMKDARRNPAGQAGQNKGGLAQLVEDYFYGGE